MKRRWRHSEGKSATVGVCDSPQPEQNIQLLQLGGLISRGLEKVRQLKSATVCFLNCSKNKLHLNQQVTRFATVLQLLPLKGGSATGAVATPLRVLALEAAQT